MNKIAISSVALLGAASFAAVGYWAGVRAQEQEASRYLYDVTSHMALSCANEQLVALLDFREGRTAEAIHGLELLVAAKLENLDPQRIADATIAKRSLADLRAPLAAYQAKFGTPKLDPKTNPRLSGLLGNAR